MSGMQTMGTLQAQGLDVGRVVWCFDPRTVGVMREARVVSVGRRWVHVDFGLTGCTRSYPRDVVEVRGYAPDMGGC